MINDHKYKIEDQILLLNVWEQWKCEALNILSTPELRAICLKQVFFAANYSNILAPKVKIGSFHSKYKNNSEILRQETTTRKVTCKQG